MQTTNQTDLGRSYGFHISYTIIHTYNHIHLLMVIYKKIERQTGKLKNFLHVSIIHLICITQIICLWLSFY